MEIGKIIKSARINKKFTQEQLADMVGVQKSAVAKWENGRVSEIKRSNLKKLAEALEIDPILLLDDVDEYIKESATEIADLFFDAEIMDMMELYISFNDSKKKQVREFIKFLSMND